MTGPVFLISVSLIVGTECIRHHKGPLAVVVDWLQHVRAAWFWLTRDAAAGVWERRSRYGEWLEMTRRGRI